MTVNWADMPETKRLKEFILTVREDAVWLYRTQEYEAYDSILAEIERLEKDRP